MNQRSPLRKLLPGLVGVGIAVLVLFAPQTATAQSLYPPASVPPASVPPLVVPPAAVPPSIVPAAPAPASAAPTTAAAKVADPPVATVLSETLAPAPNVAVESANISAVSPAYTGASSTLFAAIGLALFGVGAVLVAASRRRTPKTA